MTKIGLVLADEHFPLALVPAAGVISDAQPAYLLDYTRGFGGTHKTRPERSRAVGTRPNLFGVPLPRRPTLAAANRRPRRPAAVVSGGPTKTIPDAAWLRVAFRTAVQPCYRTASQDGSC
jgi:hypothetical protein